MRVRTLAVAATLALTGALVSPAPSQAAAGTSCKGMTKHTAHIKRPMFAGHWIIFDFTWCTYRPKGFIGPVKGGLKGMSTPVFTHPSSEPLSLGETLKTTQKPYHYSTTSKTFEYRVVVSQGHVATPKVFNQEYAIKLQVRRNTEGRKVGRLCFVGRSCSKWQA